MPACPHGHESDDPDWCDLCGLALVAPPPPPPPAASCPVCEAPLVVGEYRTETVHEMPGARFTCSQWLSISVNGALAAKLQTWMASSPVFVTVTTCGALEVFGACAPNLRVSGVAETFRAGGGGGGGGGLA